MAGDQWKAEPSGYGWTHYSADGRPTGWVIGLYRIDGVPTYMLWNGGQTQGRFTGPEGLEQAKARHAEIARPGAAEA